MYLLTEERWTQHTEASHCPIVPCTDLRIDAEVHTETVKIFPWGNPQQSCPLPRESLNNISLTCRFPQYLFPFPRVTLTFCSLNRLKYRGISCSKTRGKISMEVSSPAPAKITKIIIHNCEKSSAYCVRWAIVNKALCMCVCTCVCACHFCVCELWVQHHRHNTAALAACNVMFLYMPCHVVFAVMRSHAVTCWPCCK